MTRILRKARPVFAVVALLVGLASASLCRADDTPIPWTNKKLEQPDGSVLIEGKANRTQTNVLVVEKPNVPSHRYRLVGQVKYEDVQGVGFLEMWSRIPGQGEFFSRTLAQGGFMGAIEGSSDWRNFELPFISEPDKLPDRLTVNVVLPGPGKVWLKPVTLQSVPDGMAGVLPGDRHDPRWGIWIGPIFGPLIGLWGALVGVLGAFVASRRAGWFVAMLGIPCGVLLLLAGLLAFGFGMHVGVWSALLGCGTLMGLLGVFASRAIGQRLADDELRKMQSIDSSFQ